MKTATLTDQEWSAILLAVMNREVELRILSVNLDQSVNAEYWKGQLAELRVAKVKLAAQVAVEV